ncbi:SGNH/GDSL hydrolase family protein [Williamsia sp.]|uniref:SGNH/GDSL hydrolase family protein n=1 Tax=Williamsia sp. TaxID=1872085 RepID=UPI002F955393
MGSIIKEDFSDIALDSVDIVVTFSAPAGRPKSGTTGLLTSKGRPVRAPNGQLVSPELDSGHCRVLIEAGSWVESFDIIVPESGQHRLRDLRETYEVPDPPQVSEVKALRDEVVAAAGIVEAGLEGVVQDDDPRLDNERPPTDHPASKVTSGVFPVARGGLGRSDLVDGSFMRGAGTGAVQMRTPAQVIDDIGAAASSPAKNPKLTKWARALARRATRAARLLDISDSMDEMTTDGWGSVWPHQLMGGAKRFFIPAHTTWNQNEVVSGEALFNLGVPSGSAFGVAPAVAISGVPRLWPIRDEANDGAMSISIAGYSKVSVLWVDAAGASLFIPKYSVDGATAVSLPAGVTYSGSVKISELPVTGSTLSITRGTGGKWMVYGLIVEQGAGAIPIEVMNLSRSGSKAWDWNVWLAASIGAESGATALPTGFDPDLIHIGLLGGANDFYGGTPIAGHLSAMEALVASLQSRCPNADFVFSTQPPLPSNSAWQTWQAQSVAWAQSKGYVLLDWSSLPVPSASPYYMADQTHPRRALSTLCRDLAAPVLLPASSDVVAPDQAAIDARVRAVGDGTYAPGSGAGSPAAALTTATGRAIAFAVALG